MTISVVTFIEEMLDFDRCIDRNWLVDEFSKLDSSGLASRTKKTVSLFSVKRS